MSGENEIVTIINTCEDCSLWYDGHNGGEPGCVQQIKNCILIGGRYIRKAETVEYFNLKLGRDA